MTDLTYGDPDHAAEVLAETLSEMIDAKVARDGTTVTTDDLYAGEANRKATEIASIAGGITFESDGATITFNEA